MTERMIDPTEALMRIPIRASSIRDTLLGFAMSFARKELVQKNLGERTFSLKLADVLLLEKADSFQRDPDTEFTRQWSRMKIDPTNPWYLTLGQDGDDFKWWQMTEIMPVFDLGDLKLVCVERNSQKLLEPRNFSSNKNSEFTFVLAKQWEIDLFKNDSVWVDGHFQI